MPRADAGRKRCAIYTRKSSEEGLEQEFNSLAAQREACEAYIRSRQHEGWVLARTRYDDGGFSGGNLERPALQGLLADIRAGRIQRRPVQRIVGKPAHRELSYLSAGSHETRSWRGDGFEPSVPREEQADGELRFSDAGRLSA